MPEPTAQVFATIEAPPGEVWLVLTDPANIERYFFGAKVETDWREGSEIKFKGDWKGQAYEDKGEIIEVDPGRRLVYSHWSPLQGEPDDPDYYHLVAIDLSPLGEDATEVMLTQSNLNHEPTDADREKQAEFETNWRMMLDGLKQTVEA